MKPPVEAPTSSATSPAGSISNASSAAASLWPPRLTYGAGSVTASGRVGRDQVARLAVEAGGVALPHPDLAGQHQRLRPAPRLDQPPLDEQLVEPDARQPWRSGGRVVGAGLTRLSWHSPLHRGLTARRTASACGDLGARRASHAASSRASRTWAARPGASSRSTRRRSATEPWSTNRSPGMPRIRTGDVAVGRIGQAGLLDELQDAAPEPAGHDALLERHDHAACRGPGRGSAGGRAAARTGR